MVSIANLMKKLEKAQKTSHPAQGKESEELDCNLSIDVFPR